MELIERSEILAVSRLPPDASWPVPPADGSFYSATRTDAELTVACNEASAPAGSRVEPGWRVLSVVGPLDFAMVGVISALTTCLADAGISVFVLSTFDTDHLMIRAEAFNHAIAVLRSAGHAVH